ncbi:MAG: two-component sensor histidine kinase [candidate division Zixibacteria bacterium CG_4_9_14_3_um_filter_46_8]|nr:MAG: two-component sensor histidine kinase [candidate division Zixibacteria bacterium CG_4_9_14_3_um_filter_46_8]
MNLFPKDPPVHTRYSLLFKLFVVAGMVAVVLLFVIYTQSIISKLQGDAVRISGVYAKLWQLAASDATSGPEINVIFEEVIQKSNFPIIITDPNNIPQFWKEVDVAADDTTLQGRNMLTAILRKMDKGAEPIPIFYGEENKRIIHYLHYGDPPVVQQLQWMPFIEGIVVAVFIAIAIIVFRNIKRSEQRSIWVGMAKETAHQLGTPLSSLLGWLELIRMKGLHASAPNGDISSLNLSEITERMTNDVKRLERIANRFGQIGSMPELKPSDINQVIKEVIDYYSVRIPNHGKGVELRGEYGRVASVNVNIELISWVIENLIKNSLESINPKNGLIMIRTKPCEEDHCIKIIVTDNGRGIPARQQKRIFFPGFTTKKRGWGLGLTLARRIVEEYHRGKIKLVESIPYKRTAFEITLPST